MTVQQGSSPSLETLESVADFFRAEPAAVSLVLDTAGAFWPVARDDSPYGYVVLGGYGSEEDALAALDERSANR
jgi:hypothetical protein